MLRLQTFVLKHNVAWMNLLEIKLDIKPHGCICSITQTYVFERIEGIIFYCFILAYKCLLYNRRYQELTMIWYHIMSKSWQYRITVCILDLTVVIKYLINHSNYNSSTSFIEAGLHFHGKILCVRMEIKKDLFYFSMNSKNIEVLCHDSCLGK